MQSVSKHYIFNNFKIFKVSVERVGAEKNEKTDESEDLQDKRYAICDEKIGVCDENFNLIDHSIEVQK